MDRLSQAPQPEVFGDAFLLAARLPQAEKVPQSTSDAFRVLCEAQFAVFYTSGRFLVEVLLSRLGGPRWTDLSQFQINPYFLDQLEDCLQLTHGSFVVTIEPRLQHDLRDRALPTGLEQLVDTMFLTSPPCKVLGIYALSPESARPSPEGLHSVKRLHRANGIRVGDLLRQIRQLMPTAIRRWRDNSRTIHQHIEREDWTRMSSHSSKCQALGGPGFPKLFGFLEFAEDFRVTCTQCTY